MEQKGCNFRMSDRYDNSSYSTYLHMHREVTYDVMSETESDWFVATFRPIFCRTKSRLSRELGIIHSLFSRASCLCQAGQGASIYERCVESTKTYQKVGYD